jgi:putative cell wall-binding protein
VKRIAGTERDDTAAHLAAAGYPSGGANIAVLARDDLFADALAGSPLAAELGGPAFLTHPDSLTPTTRAALQSVLAPGATVILLGGPHALSPGVAASVAGMGYHVERIAGGDRFVTATAIADRLQSTTGVKNIWLASGLTFADALPAAAAAGANHGAILLTNGSAMAPSTAAWLAAHTTLPATAVGAPASQADPGMTSLAGANRYLTSLAVEVAVFPHPTGLAIATGVDFPDALTASAYAARQGWGLMLVDPSLQQLSPEQLAFLHICGTTAKTVVIVGGPVAIPQTTMSMVSAALVG